MIWGQVINSVRSVHLELLDQYSIIPTLLSADLELSSDEFPFPAAGDEFDDWETLPISEKIQEALEFHAVERVLIEGPLLPIQEVILNDQEWDKLFRAIVLLETQWLKLTKLFSDEKVLFIENSLRSKFNQLKEKRPKRFGLKIV